MWGAIETMTLTDTTAKPIRIQNSSLRTAFDEVRLHGVAAVLQMLVVLVLLLIGARLALSPTLATINTAMAMAMAVTDDDVGLVRGDS